MAAYVTPEEIPVLCPELAGQVEEMTPLLDGASDDVDALCFGRIRQAGIENLSDFQREKVKKAVCYHAAFLNAYGDEVDSPLSSYGINGVSMSFDASKVIQQGNVTTSPKAYSQLIQSGLAYRGIR